MLRLPRSVVVAVGVVVALAQAGSAQGLLPYSLFERYLDALRQQSGIPGLSAAILKDGRIEWERGFGLQDVDRQLPASADTPYPVGSLTQTLAAVLLGMCSERGMLNIDEPIRRWVPDFPEAAATVRHLLAHASTGAPAGTFRFDGAAYASLTPVVQDCFDESFRVSAADEILERLGMASSVPGADLAQEGNPARELFTESRLERYEGVLARMAVPYRVERSGRATRFDLASPGLNAAEGLVSTVRDIARLDAALDDDGVLLRADTLRVAWTPAQFGGAPLPTGLGWFVQPYQGERLVWHFSHASSGYSALILKMPARRLTLILMANSDGLNTGANLEQGDVTQSPFVKVFLRLFT